MQNTQVLNESSDNESSDSYVLATTRKRPRRMIIDESSEEESTKSQSWIWQKVKNTPIVWKYSETHGIKAVLNNLSEDPKILDLFSIVFDNKLWEILITETNRFAYQTMHDEYKRRKVDDNWYPVPLDEVKAYYALCILMSQVKKLNVQLYWTTRAVVETPIFRKTMPFKRFRQISRFLHFSDNETADSSD